MNITNLSGKVSLAKVKEIAAYYQVAENIIELAIKKGAKTMNDVYRFIKIGEV